MILLQNWGQQRQQLMARTDTVVVPNGVVGINMGAEFVDRAVATGKLFDVVEKKTKASMEVLQLRAWIFFESGHYQ